MVGAFYVSPRLPGSSERESRATRDEAAAYSGARAPPGIARALPLRCCCGRLHHIAHLHRRSASCDLNLNLSHWSDMTDTTPAIPPFTRLSLEDGFHHFDAETSEFLPGKAILSVRHCKGSAVLWVAAVPLADPALVWELDIDNGPTTFDRVPEPLRASALVLGLALEGADYGANRRALLAEFPNRDELLARVPGVWGINHAGECCTAELTGSNGSHDKDNAGAVLTALEQAMGCSPGNSALSTYLDGLDLDVTVKGTGVYHLLAWARAQNPS